MNNTLNKTISTTFILAGGLHLVRFFMGWDMMIDSFLFPAWASLLLGIFLLSLAYKTCRIK